MKSSKSLSRRILFWMTLVGLVPLLVMALESHFYNKHSIIESEKEHLSFALQSRLIWLTEWLRFTRKEFLYASRPHCPKAHEGAEHSSEHVLHRALDGISNGHAKYRMLAAYDTEWKLIVNADNSVLTEPAPTLKELVADSDDFVASRNHMIDNGEVFIPVGQPAFNTNEKKFAYIIAELNLSKSLNRILGDSGDLGETGKLYLVSKDGQYLSHSFGFKSVMGKTGSLPPELLKGPYGKIIYYNDWQGNAVLGISAPLPEMEWVLVAEVDEAEAFQALPTGLMLALITGLMTFIFVFSISFRSSRSLSKPLRELARVAQKISKGEKHERTPEFPDLETQEVGVAFNNMLDKLEVSQRALVQNASLAAVGELSSSIAHEMRSPLSTIKITLQAIKEHFDGDSPFGESIDIASDQSDRLKSMLDDLLQYSKPLELKRERVRFQSIIREVMNAVHNKLKQKEITLETKDELADRELNVDRELIVRALINLVENAIYWSAQNGLILIEGIRQPEDESFISFKVSDKGPGLQQEHLDKVFQPFFSTRKEGTGIGLANVKKITEYHNGFVLAKNNEQGGALFIINLPLEGPQYE